MENIAYLPLALPVDEEAVLVDLEQAGELDFRVVLLLGPSIEVGPGAQRLRHLDLPIELEPLRHRRSLLQQESPPCNYY